jgi:hypothetical protein
MRRDYGEWKPAMEAVLVRIEAGDWRHGLKTKDAVQHLLRLARFPAQTASMWAPRYRKRCGEFLEHALYYWVQSHIKNRRFKFLGASGKVYRLRAIHNVEHGNGNGELSASGKAPAPEKQGLWLRDEDMHLADVRLVRGAYTSRRSDGGAEIRYLDVADAALSGKPADAVVGDVRDEIARAL